MKFVISNKKGKAKQHEVEDASAVYGVKIGDKFLGEKIGLEGYEFEVRGGTDDAGFPMRRDVQGDIRRKILITKSLGNRDKIKGRRKRKSVSGNTIGEATAQVNVLVLKVGADDMFAEPVAEEAAAEEKKEE